jgi:small subunit ribosomal protein S17
MPKRVLTGTVVSDKGDKTIVVRVERRVKHPLYGKIIRLSKKYHAHDAANEFRAGEIVRIEECAPISKLKTWSVVDRIGAAKAAVVEITEPEALAPDAPAETPKPIEEKAEKPVEKKPAEKKPPVKKPPVKKPAKKTKAKDVAKADA